MASLMEELINVLQQEQEQYSELLTVSLEKTAVIVSNNLTRLQEIAVQEQDILDILVNLDRKRDTCMQSIASVMNRKPKHLTVTQIIDMMEGQPEYQNVLAKLHGQLKSTVEQLRQVSTHNQDLLSEAIEMTEFEINLVQSLNQAPETANYGKGTYSGATLGTSVSSFDAKQ